MSLATDYLGHDGEYRRRRAQGLPGWGDEKGLLQKIGSIDSFLAGLPLPSAPTMIELGCGAGDLSLFYAAKGFHVTGFDIAPYAIEWAREKASQQHIAASFLIADLTRDLDPLPPPADIVLDGSCLHCIIGPDREVFFRNARRCLKPGGVFHIFSMCGNPHPPMSLNFDPVSRCLVTRGVARRYLGTCDGILQEVIQAGFQVERQEVIPAPSTGGDQDCVLINARLRD